MPRWDCVNTRQREPAEGAGTRPAHPSLSSPDGADWRKNARLFAYSPRVQCRDGLAAGAKWIRTLGPTLGIIVSRSLLSSSRCPTATRWGRLTTAATRCRGCSVRASSWPNRSVGVACIDQDEEFCDARPVPLWESGNHHFANGEPKVRIHLAPPASQGEPDFLRLIGSARAASMEVSARCARVGTPSMREH
jgi:hypothetical protein